REKRERSKVDLLVVPVSGRRVCARAVAGTAVLSYKSFLKASLSYPPIFALSDLWLRPNPWCMVVIKVRFREVEALFTPPPSVLSSGGGGLPSSVVAVLSPEGGGYSSSTLPVWNPLEIWVLAVKVRVGGPDESAVCPMTLSVEDHREGRCFVAGYEIRRNEARWLRRRLEAETVRLRRCATRVDSMAQMLPRFQQPVSSTRLIQPTSVGLDWFGPRAVYSG
ncbi:LOW QUALITY PROTEIN: hypothetical protein HID58_005667, partial [Brassica napus]